MELKQKRVILWTCSRSLSTAFYRAITNPPDTLGILEPYYEAHRYGGSAEWTGDPNSPDHPGSIFKDIKVTLQQPYSDYKTVFVKALAIRPIISPYKVKDILPEGYIHTFLVRDPRKTVTSMYKMYTKKEIKGWTRFDTSYGETKELYELYTYLTTEMGMECLVVDADDLENDPETALRMYCSHVGIPYHESMMDWTLADPSRLDQFKEESKRFPGTFFDSVLKSTTFNKPPERSLDLSKYPPIVREIVEMHLPYYELLRKERAIINK